ncbi:MAG: exodeoxyribonuclease V subunit gamma [Acidimicrobiales bacterium]
MSGLTLYASSDLRPLAAHFVADQRPGADPLRRRTVVVPNVLVGQWFEQEVARRTGRAGRGDGVAANLDAIFLTGLLGRLLYGDAAGMDRWSGPALGVEIFDLDGNLSLSEARRRGDALARLVALRSEELDERLDAEPFAAERALLAARAGSGLWPPRRQFERAGLTRPDAAGDRLTLFGCLASPVGALAAEVVRAVADIVPVDLYVAVPARDLLDVDVATVAPEERSLLERWGAPAGAHLGVWRRVARPERVEWLEVASPEDEERRAVIGALASHDLPGGAARVTPFVEVHQTVGLARQVEVARDALLHAIDELGVAPHDVRVVTAAPDAVVPLLATYWQPTAVEDEGAPRLQFEVADPGARRRSSRVDAFVRLLRALDAPLTQHDVAALLGEPSLLAGLGLSRAEAERVLSLAREGRVSLGLDAGDPVRAGIFAAHDDAGSWRRLVDRVALAACLDPADEPAVVATLGVAEDLEAVARFDALVGLLAEARGPAREAHPLGVWCERLTSWVRVIERDERVRDPSLDGVLTRLGALAATSTRPVPFADVRDLVESLASGTGGASLLGRGGVSLVDAEGASSIPYAVTCVLGVDEELLPEPARRVGEWGEARPTDPDPRAEFRLALLNLVASTERRVLLFTSDRRVVDGAVLPTSLPLVELADALASGPAGSGRAPTVRRHPRYGFSPGGSGVVDVAAADSSTPAFTFDPVHAATATQLAARRPSSPEDDVPLYRVTDVVTPGESAVAVEELVRFFRNPQRIFLRDVYSSAQVSDATQTERPDAPFLDAGDALHLFPLRERLLRRAVETGVDPAAPEGADTDVASVATGFRARSTAALDLEGLTRFAAHVRRSLLDAHAARAPIGRRPAIVAGATREVSRAPVELYDSDVGPVLVEYTPSRDYRSRLIGLVVRQAVVTAETGAPVTAVLLRGASSVEAQHPDERPYLVSTWRGDDARGTARAVLDALLALYDKRLERLPLHLNATSLATDPRFCGRDDGFLADAAREWLRPGAFTGGADWGESTTPENRFLLPLTMAELRTVFDGQFTAQSAELTTALRPLTVRAYLSSESWVACLGARRGGRGG